jgi:hypothetical protein
LVFLSSIEFLMNLPKLHNSFTFCVDKSWINLRGANIVTFFFKNLVLRRSKHPLLTGHTRRVPLVEIRYTGLPVVKASMGMTVLQIV